MYYPWHLSPGTIHLANGDKYVGDWKDGRRHGLGVYYYNDGDRYEGEWRNDERHGRGTMFYGSEVRYGTPNIHTTPYTIHHTP
ncbi:hypothetical protein EON63_08540 [archaeon]|nr:MAG: hypothetical protein EON63_08540 [archaeon]